MKRRTAVAWVIFTAASITVTSAAYLDSDIVGALAVLSAALFAAAIVVSIP